MTAALTSPSTDKLTFKKRTKGFILALPAIFWMTFFFLLPLVSVLIISFLTRGQGGTVAPPFTTENYQDVFSGTYFPVVLRSVWIALITTLICLLIGYPLAFYISTRKNNLTRQFALFLVILPFWTNFLVRTYAIQTLIGQEGFINGLLLNAGLIQEPLPMILTPGAVILGLVYGFLPFMILPIYASAERLDFRLVEAAHDLGANDWRAFWRVVFPLTLPGVVAGSILVFIPAIGAFVTPDLLGGRSGFMIGNLIQSQFGATGNQPRGAATSVVLMALVMVALFVYIRFGQQERQTS